MKIYNIHNMPSRIVDYKDKKFLPTKNQNKFWFFSNYLVSMNMPIGVPRIIYCWSEELPAQWTDIYNFIFRKRMIFLMQHLDNEICNQICGLLINIHMEDRTKDLDEKKMLKSSEKSNSMSGPKFRRDNTSNRYEDKNISSSSRGGTSGPNSPNQRAMPTDGSNRFNEANIDGNTFFSNTRAVDLLKNSEEDLAIDELAMLEQYTLQKITLEWLNWNAQFFDYSDEPYLFYLAEILSYQKEDNSNLLYGFVRNPSTAIPVLLTQNNIGWTNIAQKNLEIRKAFSSNPGPKTQISNFSDSFQNLSRLTLILSLNASSFLKKGTSLIKHAIPFFAGIKPEGGVESTTNQKETKQTNKKNSFVYFSNKFLQKELKNLEIYSPFRQLTLMSIMFILNKLPDFSKTNIFSLPDYIDSKFIRTNSGITFPGSMLGSTAIPTKKAAIGKSDLDFFNSNAHNVPFSKILNYFALNSSFISPYANSKAWSVFDQLSSSTNLSKMTGKNGEQQLSKQETEDKKQEISSNLAIPQRIKRSNGHLIVASFSSMPAKVGFAFVESSASASQHDSKSEEQILEQNLTKAGATASHGPKYQLRKEKNIKINEKVLGQRSLKKEYNQDYLNLSSSDLGKLDSRSLSQLKRLPGFLPKTKPLGSKNPNIKKSDLQTKKSTLIPNLYDPSLLSLETPYNLSISNSLLSSESAKNDVGDSILGFQNKKNRGLNRNFSTSIKASRSGSSIDDGIRENKDERIMRLIEEESENKLFVLINSFGGSVGNGITIHDAMQFIRGTILTVGLGVVASAASLALAGGTIGDRYITEACHAMIHQPEGGVSGQASDLWIESQEILKIRLNVAEIYSLTTYRPRHKVLRDLDRDFYLTASEACAYGLADYVATSAVMHEIIQATNSAWDYQDSKQQRLLEKRLSLSSNPDTQSILK